MQHWRSGGSLDGDMRLGVMPPGDLPGVIRPGVLPKASKSRSGAYCTCGTAHHAMSMPGTANADLVNFQTMSLRCIRPLQILMLSCNSLRQAGGVPKYLYGISQLLLVQHEPKAARAQGCQLAHYNVLAHAMHAVLLREHGRPAATAVALRPRAISELGANAANAQRGTFTGAIEKCSQAGIEPTSRSQNEGMPKMHTWCPIMCASPQSQALTRG